MDNTACPPKRKRNARSGSLPWFRFWPADWLSDVHVMAMTLEQEGAYIRLLCFCWREGSLPSDLAILARLVKVDEDHFRQHLWRALEPCFTTGNDGRLTQRRMDAERRVASTTSQLQRARRLTGIRNSRQPNQLAVDRIATGSQPESTIRRQKTEDRRQRAEGGGAGSSSEMEISSNRDLPQPRVEGARSDRKSFVKKLDRDPPRFGEFWDLFPRKVGRGDARAAWLKINPPLDTIERILAAVETQKDSWQWRRDGGQFVPHPSTWLNQRRWEDEPEPSSPPATTKQTAEDEEWKREKARLLRGIDPKYTPGAKGYMK